MSRRNRALGAGLGLALLALAGAQSAPVAPQADMVLVPAGSYVPAFARQSRKPGAPANPAVAVASFWIDRAAVTNAQFLAFVTTHPQWRRSQVKALFADEHYLKHWRGDVSLAGGEDAARPVTGVSWFAAKAYCEARGAQLPTTEQWEFALWDKGRNADDLKARQLAWFSVPSSKSLPSAALAPANGYGIRGLVGSVWELTLDLDNSPAGSDTRTGAEKPLYCGGASVGARDPSDYAAFMRYAFRSCLKPAYTTRDMGFRCAGQAP